MNTTNQPLVGPILHCFEKCFLKNDEMDDESARFPMQNSMRYNPEENSSQSSESDRMSRKRKWFQLETE
ncbi:MAG: hypothetical protein HWD61_00300 [Parachlamydiaceae bacterium]|nr:MAG: hypothetical protein HWD61_00300 [Parachlamydiaceae bacterium]